LEIISERCNVVTVGALAALLAGCSGALAPSIEGEASRPAPSQVSARSYPLRDRAAQAALWATGGYNLLFGMNKTLTKVVATIDTMANGCYSPGTVKIDHDQNIWISCQLLHPIGSEPFLGEQEYGRGGAWEKSFVYNGAAQCGYEEVGCIVSDLDGGWDNSGHVFAELSYGVNTNPPYNYINPGFYWWNAKDPARSPKFIQASLVSAPFGELDYMDTDSLGNIWFDFESMSVAGCAPSGLGEVTNPTTSPSVKVIFPAGTYQCAGGVYVSHHGTVLNVTDQGTRLIYQYHLPVTPSSVAFKILGPTRADPRGEGAPVSGGFNKTESAMALSDRYGWIDVGKLPENSWNRHRSALCPCPGAAFTPSDK
jgi:hypothetical protein